MQGDLLTKLVLTLCLLWEPPSHKSSMGVLCQRRLFSWTSLCPFVLTLHSWTLCSTFTYYFDAFPTFLSIFLLIALFPWVAFLKGVNNHWVSLQYPVSCTLLTHLHRGKLFPYFTESLLVKVIVSLLISQPRNQIFDFLSCPTKDTMFGDIDDAFSCDLLLSLFSLRPGGKKFKSKCPEGQTSPLQNLWGKAIPCLFKLLVATGIYRLWNYHFNLCLCLHMASFPACLCFFPWQSFCKDTGHIGLGLIIMTSFELGKRPISK